MPNPGSSERTNSNPSCRRGVRTNERIAPPNLWRIQSVFSSRVEILRTGLDRPIYDHCNTWQPSGAPFAWHRTSLGGRRTSQMSPSLKPQQLMPVGLKQVRPAPRISQNSLHSQKPEEKTTLTSITQPSVQNYGQKTQLLELF